MPEANPTATVQNRPRASSIAAHNLPPINTLPVELLSSIFILYAKDLHDTYLGYSYTDGKTTEILSRRWVKLMLVCYLWRNIVIHTPQLWRSIEVTGNIDTLKLRLTRSSPSTIDLFFLPCPTIITEAIPILLPEACRIRSIRSIGNCTEIGGCRRVTPRVLRSIQPLFAQSLPALECIAFSSSPPPNAAVSRDEPFDLGLTEERHPRIRNFTCHNIRLPPSPAFWSVLRELHLGIHFARQRTRLSDEILRILSSASCLEILDISDRTGQAHSPALSGPMTPTARIVLPHLRTITMMGSHDPSFVLTILQHIQPPVLRELEVSIRISDNMNIGRLVQSMLLPTAHTLISTLDQLRIRSTWHGLSITDCQQPAAHRFALRLLYGPRARHPSNIAALEVLCHALAGAPLKHLQFDQIHDCDGDVGATLHLWQLFLATFKSLDTICLSKSGFSIVYWTLNMLATPVDGKLSLHPSSVVIVEPTHRTTCNTLLCHGLISRLQKFAAARAAANLELRVALEIASVPRNATVARASPPSLKMHRWMLLALQKLCDFRFKFTLYDSYSPAELSLESLFDDAEFARILAEGAMKAQSMMTCTMTAGET